MIQSGNFGFLAIIPVALAVILAFITKDAIIALLIACIVGLMIAGGGPAESFSLMGALKGITNLPKLLEKTLGNQDFVWVLLIEVFIGVLIAFLRKTGSSQEFERRMSTRIKTRKKAQISTWLFTLIIFSDYFTPLFVGAIFRGITDKARVSREKLSYILDSCSAPKSVLLPFTGWAVYTSSLLVGYGPITDRTIALGLYIKAIPLDFYAIFALFLVPLIALGVVPEFGPMKRAEKRAYLEGKPIRDGAIPLMSKELADISKADQIIKPKIIMNFIVPLLIVFVVAIGTMIITGTPKTLEAFMISSFFLGAALFLERVPIRDIMETVLGGIKGVMPAVIILALAFAINSISKDLGTATYVIEITKRWLTPSLLPLLTFAIAALISFATGTSWGTFAIVIPISIPLAFQFTGGKIALLVILTLSAICGGSVFGDHCSPVSDTTILASLGSACDHIDHVRTQIPYAFLAAVVAAAVYLAIGVF